MFIVLLNAGGAVLEWRGNGFDLVDVVVAVEEINGNLGEQQRSDQEKRRNSMDCSWFQCNKIRNAAGNRKPRNRSFD